MAEHPCPAVLPQPLDNRCPPRRCLFLLDASGQITGAIRRSYSYPKDQAQVIFRSEPWLPATPDQLWPSSS